MLGLFAFFYGCIHFSIYVGLDQMLDLQRHLGGRDETALHHRWIYGFCSDDPSRRNFHGGMIRGWVAGAGQMLHRAIYLTAIAGVIHFYWLVKSDVHVPLEYAAIMAILLGWRVYVWFTGPRRHAPVKTVTPKQSTTPAVD